MGHRGEHISLQILLQMRAKGADLAGDDRPGRPRVQSAGSRLLLANLCALHPEITPDGGNKMVGN